MSVCPSRPRGTELERSRRNTDRMTESTTSGSGVADSSGICQGPQARQHLFWVATGDLEIHGVRAQFCIF